MNAAFIRAIISMGNYLPSSEIIGPWDDGFKEEEMKRAGI